VFWGVFSNLKGASKVLKSSFKIQQEKLRVAKTKQKKYNQLIKGLKYNRNVRQSKLDKKALVKELNRSLTEVMPIEDCVAEENVVKPSDEVEVSEITKKNETDVYEFNDAKSESENSSDEDDDVPISSLIKKETALVVPEQPEGGNNKKDAVLEDCLNAKLVCFL